MNKGKISSPVARPAKSSSNAPFRLNWRRWLAALAVLGLSGTGSFLQGGAGISAAQAVKEALADPSSIFAGRSPGQRDPNALFQTKPVRNLIDDSPLPALPEENLIEDSPLPPVGEAPPTAFMARPENPDMIVPQIVPVTGPPQIFSGFPPPPVITSGPPVILLPPDRPVIPGVPEPSSWMTMIAGFLSIGAALRRARRGNSGRPIRSSVVIRVQPFTREKAGGAALPSYPPDASSAY